MIIKNYTPHSINIIRRESTTERKDIRKLVSESPVIIATIPSDGILNVRYELRKGATINDIPIIVKVLAGIDEIPADCDVAIVSGLYASATDDPRAYTVIDPVYDPEGERVVGCLAIGKVQNS